MIDRNSRTRTPPPTTHASWNALRHGWLRHTGDPGLTRHALNAYRRVLPYGDARFDRPTQSRRDVFAQPQRVIDALVAAAMVHSAATEQREADEIPAMVSIYASS